MKRLSLLLGLLSFISYPAFAVVVTLSSPTNNSQSSAPVHLVASAVSVRPITGWVAYIDSQIVYVGPPTSKIDTWFSANQGTHQLVVRAWDSAGAYASQSVQIQVVSDGLPTPPPNAIVFNHIEDNGNWGSCNGADCAGGSGQGVYWMAQNQAAPSLSGRSTEFYTSGVWENALWWQKLGNNDAAHNLLWDFFFYVDSNYNVSAQALEFDTFQFISGYNYMIGTECDYGAQIWDTWDEAAGHWIHSNIPCPHFAANTWHHIQLYTQTNASAHQYKYVTLVVDGQSTPVNFVGNARYLNWGDNIGVQWQLDINKNGSGIHEWIDNAKLTVW